MSAGLTAENLLSQIRPISRETYHAVAETGGFEGQRVELIEGVVYALAPQKSNHAITVRKITERFVPPLLGRAVCQVQLPLALGDSEPEPDFAVLYEATTDELSRDDHPTRARLVLEVAESTLAKDREIKGRLYAEAGIPDYWIVNLAERVLEIHRRPEGPEYRLRSVHGEDETVTPADFEDLQIVVRDLLP